VGLVWFARYCDKMSSRHLFSYGGLAQTSLSLNFAHLSCFNFNNTSLYFFQNDLTFLRVRSKKHEILVAPGKFPCKVCLPSRKELL